MSFRALVLYPNEADTKFDLDYYLKSHMPLVAEKFGKHGLKKWDVLEFKPGGDGAKPTYCIGATLYWDSPDHMGAALASEDAKPVFGDIPNFCNKGPVFLGGALVGEA